MRALVVAQQLRQPVPGGIGTYTRGLVVATGRAGDAVDLTLLASAPPRGRPDPLAALAPVVTSKLPARALLPAWASGVVKAPGGYDVVHGCSLAFPQPVAGEALVVAVHDVAWRHVPDAFPAHGRRWHEAAVQRAGAQADVVVVPAPGIADDLGLQRRARVEVLEPMYGCDHLPVADDAGTDALLSALGVTGPFVLSVGTLEPRKNLARVIAAHAAAAAQLPELWPLVVVGPSGWGEAVAPPAGVVLAGVVAPAVLAGLYARARCLVYVPLLEGWGLPPVEAMAAGTPVVASPMPSTGGAATEVDPEDVDAIAAAIVAAACDEDVRAALRAAGRRRADALTWDKAAQSHVDLWRSLA